MTLKTEVRAAETSAISQFYSIFDQINSAFESRLKELIKLIQSFFQNH